MPAVKEINLVSDAEKNQADYRLPPYNIEAEQVILGAILTNNDLITKVQDFLNADHFYEPLHNRIYSSIISFMDKGLIATPVTLKNIFDKDEDLLKIGGGSYLVKLAANATGIINVMDYARVIYDLSLRRQLINIGEEIVNEAYKDEADTNAANQIEKAEHKLFTIASEGGSDKNFVHLRASLSEALKRAEMAQKKDDAITGVPTGYSDLDRMLGGMHDSDLLIIAARPSMGKTALAVNIAVNAAHSFAAEFEKEKNASQNAFELKEHKIPKTVGLFSLEMSSEQLATRILSMKTGINSNDIRRGKFLKKTDFEHLITANKELYSLPFMIDETPAISISALRTRARRLKRKNNLGLIVIDYLQLIRGVSEQGRSNRVQEVSEITQGLKAIAKELNVPVVALSQLSRVVETRDDKRPQLSDLRESGTIEQDADVVMFIYRAEYYEERKEPSEKQVEEYSKWQAKMAEVSNIADIMIAKHRNGPVGNVELFFDKNTTTFKDYIKDKQKQEISQYIPSKQEEDQPF